MVDLRLVKMEPNKAYVSDMLWLPKSLIAAQAIRDGLQFWDVEKGKAILCKLWDETRDHLICPREYIRPEQYPQFPFEFVDLTPKVFPKTNIWVKNEPRDEDQHKALAVFSRAQAGILNLACGKGKTYLALKRIEQLGCPALVVVHNTYLMSQWVDDAIPEHAELPPGEKIGIIQGPEFDWRRPITVAMIHTLAARVQAGEIPPGFRQHFGVVVFDEVHHLSAPLFVKTAPLITGYRFGLTATEKRLDGTDFIYKSHIGEVFYTDLRQSLIPRVYFQKTPVYVDLDAPEVKDVNGETSIPKIRTFMGSHLESNKFRARCIQEALDQGRKIICVSHSKDQLRSLHEMFPGSGLVVQETDAKERTSIVRRSQLTFAIASLGFEALDDKAMDTVFALLPFTSPNDVQQVMGRIQRPMENKSQPVFIIFEDVKVKPLKAMCRKMKKVFDKFDEHSPGMPAIPYTSLEAF